jgi:hypothetical protein
MICTYDLSLSHSFFRPGLSCFKSLLELSGEVKISPLFYFDFELIVEIVDALCFIIDFLVSLIWTLQFCVILYFWFCFLLFDLGNHEFLIYIVLGFSYYCELTNIN